MQANLKAPKLPLRLRRVWPRHSTDGPGNGRLSTPAFKLQVQPL